MRKRGVEKKRQIRKRKAKMDEKIVRQIISRLDRLERVVFDKNPAGSSHTPKAKILPKIVRGKKFVSGQEKISINEFLKTKKLEDDVKRTLAIAYWLDYFEKADSFNVSDIENTFRAARLSVPKNVNDKVNMNIKNGHIADNKEKKEGKKTWYVTNSGAELVENELNK